jgi:hypothetical protein
MSNLHGEFLSIHKISQAYPGVTGDTEKDRVKPEVTETFLSGCKRVREPSDNAPL